MRAATAHSEEFDAVSAAAELIRQSVEQLRGEVPVCAFLFATTEYDHATLLAALHEQWPDLPLVGGSTDGAVTTSGFAHESVVLTLLTGAGLRARSGLGRNLAKDPARAVAEALSAAGPATRLCWTVFAPSTNSTAVVRDLQRALGNACPVVGGLTGDHRLGTAMVEFHGREVLRDSLPVMFLEGDIAVGCGVGTGWFPIGEPRVVTKAAGHWIHEVDGMPALQVFQSYWGEMVSTATLGEYPIAVFPNGADGDYHLRAVFEVDQQRGSMRVAGEVLEGAVVRPTEVVREGILAGSTKSAAQALACYPGADPQVAFIFSCAARKWVLGTTVETEIRHLQAAFAAAGVRPAVAGGYFFGEIGPQRRDAPSEFHNETCVTVILGR
jgi:hypothetical protein